MLHNRFSLVISFMHIICVILNLPTHLIPPTLLVPLFLSCKQVHLYHFSRSHVYVLIYYFYFFLTSLCMTVSGSIHVSTNDPVSFLSIAEQYSIGYMYHIFFIHSSVGTFRLFPWPGYYKQCCGEHWVHG